MAIAIDTSALIAVIFGEPDASSIARTMLANAGDCSLSAATLVEASIVVEAKQGPAATQDLQLLIERIGAEIMPVDAQTAATAISAWRRFGKGRHRAGLNFGDCFAYALSKNSGLPLLFKGDDFTQTDIAQAG
ncbi:type II toxin-antitoxin system VapC family toxin [Gryllotalpicola protaetiae]|uniref:Ribonuclease VapC n=1 Tax=Gryllotalpicola protaetiae TaxID=2419771 RepID=A0A387C2Q4_9MICO|nr:type II toxin-antitoxin system VapC family toxin [Gryllotalpicola protaetiae]AYG04811.1 type II toxin-antitoxin system VapC family toxin [Gryllotalpicola protaetiae]